MEESVTYQAILRKGRLAEARKFLLLMSEKHLGPPSQAAKATINSMEDVERLERLGKRLTQVASWDELLPTPPRRRTNGRRSANR
jgi:hypothetical protein